MTRKNAGVASLLAPCVSDVRVADGEMCAIFAWKYVVLDAATAPEVDGPRTTSTLGFATYFCASACAGAGPCSTGVSPRTNFTLRCSFGASSGTASFAQLPCSAPRKPAPPVTGVTSGRVIVLLQLNWPAASFAAAVWLPCALAATTDVARIARARPIAFFIYVSSLPGGTLILRGVTRLN